MIRIVICDDDPCFAATLTDELTALALAANILL